MDLPDDKVFYKDLSYKIIGLAMEVHGELGCGFLEKVYENALVYLLKENGIKAEQQFPLKVMFRDSIAGEYFADILVEDKIIIELKACERLMDIHKAQVINYLKATGKKQGLLMNYGKRRYEHERLIS